MFGPVQGLTRPVKTSFPSPICTASSLECGEVKKAG
jgi:hypothetical protein